MMVSKGTVLQRGPYLCDLCDAVFQRLNFLTLHKRVHNTNGTYEYRPKRVRKDIILKEGSRQNFKQFYHGQEIIEAEKARRIGGILQINNKEAEKARRMEGILQINNKSTKNIAVKRHTAIDSDEQMGSNSQGITLKSIVTPNETPRMYKANLQYMRSLDSNSSSLSCIDMPNGANNLSDQMCSNGWGNTVRESVNPKESITPQANLQYDTRPLDSNLRCTNVINGGIFTEEVVYSMPASNISEDIFTTGTVYKSEGEDGKEYLIFLPKDLAEKNFTLKMSSTLNKNLAVNESGGLGNLQSLVSTTSKSSAQNGELSKNLTVNELSKNLAVDKIGRRGDLQAMVPTTSKSLALNEELSKNLAVNESERLPVCNGSDISIGTFLQPSIVSESESFIIKAKETLKETGKLLSRDNETLSNENILVAGLNFDLSLTEKNAREKLKDRGYVNQRDTQNIILCTGAWKGAQHCQINSNSLGNQGKKYNQSFTVWDLNSGPHERDSVKIAASFDKCGQSSGNPGHQSKLQVQTKVPVETVEILSISPQKYVCQYCKKDCKLSSRLNKHLKVHTGERPYICEYCKKGFKQSIHLKIHIRLHTGEKPYKCDKCDAAFTQSHRLKSHKEIHLSTKIDKVKIEKPSVVRNFYCKVCDKTFLGTCYKREHMKTHTNSSKDTKITHTDPKSEHIKTRTNPKIFSKYSCLKCDVTFKSRKRLIGHYKKDHGDLEEFVCNVCCQQFKNLGYLGRHMKQLHDKYLSIVDTEDSNTSKLDETNEREKALINLRENKVNDKASVMFKVEEGRKGGKVRKKRGEKEGKVGEGGGGRELGRNNKNIALCDGVLKGENSKHFQTNSIYLGNQSKQITRSFGDVHLSKPPVQTKVPVEVSSIPLLKSFKCNVCDKIFNQCSQLYLHLRTHTKERPYKCEVCDKTFRQISHLKDHFKIHTGQKSFQCDICNKKFRQSSQLSVHLKLHTNKNHKCKLCDRAFKYISDLKTHLKAHTERSFKYKMCNRGFKQGMDTGTQKIALCTGAWKGQNSHHCQISDSIYMGNQDKQFSQSSGNAGVNNLSKSQTKAPVKALRILPQSFSLKAHFKTQERQKHFSRSSAGESCIQKIHCDKASIVKNNTGNLIPKEVVESNLLPKQSIVLLENPKLNCDIVVINIEEMYTR